MTYFRRGLRSGIPIAAGFISSFIAVGVFLRQAGFDVLAATATTASVFAGPAQYGIAQAFQSSRDAWPVLAMVTLINARFFVMAASLVEAFRGVGLGRVLLAAPFLSASTFAATQLEEEAPPGRGRFDFYLGVGLMGYTAALASTLAGALLVDRVPTLSTAWLTMILPLFFCAQMSSLSRAKRDRLAAFVAGIGLTLLARPYLGAQSTLVTAAMVTAVALIDRRRRKA